jgi:hypothetical protein
VEAPGVEHGSGDVASGPTPAQLLELVDAAIVALDAGEADIARARLQELAEAVRILRHGCREMALTGVRGKKDWMTLLERAMKNSSGRAGAAGVLHRHGSSFPLPNEHQNR